MWTTICSEYLYRSPWIVVRKDAVVTEKGIKIDDFYVLEYPTWVNVIAITKEGLFLVERQYRHGIQQEVYGNCEPDEDPLHAAQRELLEETGFGKGKWSLIGRYAPNPNSMNNWCYTFLAEDVMQVQDECQEQTENITVLQVTKQELFEMMQGGKIVEGVMLAPLWQYFNNNIVMETKNSTKRKL